MANLEAVNVATCHACVIISAQLPNPEDDPVLIDMNVILTEMNIKTLVSQTRVSNHESNDLKEPYVLVDLGK